MKRLKIRMESGYMVGLKVKYPIICEDEGEDGDVVGMCVSDRSEYAKLFAASPELLDSLIEMVEWAEHYAYTAEDGILPFNISIHKAKEVIAKAQGETK